jgi:hypothetical protein
MSVRNSNLEREGISAYSAVHEQGPGFAHRLRLPPPVPARGAHWRGSSDRFAVSPYSNYRQIDRYRTAHGLGYVARTRTCTRYWIWVDSVQEKQSLIAGSGACVSSDDGGADSRKPQHAV